MRVRKERDGLTVHVVAGTNVVQLGFDVDRAVRKGLLGFAVSRADRRRAADWIPNRRNFDGAPGWVPSNEAPIQKFRWGDYTVTPGGGDYTYRVAAVHGRPGAVELGPEVELTVATEDADRIVGPDGVRHEVHINRGGTASQSYVDQFGNRTPDQVGEAAFAWLSRGLRESMMAFIDRAKRGDALHVSIYEIQHPPFLERLKAALDRGVALQILYDAGTAESAPTAANEAALTEHGLMEVSRARAGLKSRISHHKSLVLVHRGVPTAVWTGSTNMTANALYAQLNVGHGIDSEPIATAYLALHQELWDDPTLAATRSYLHTTYPSLTPMPADTPSVVFSPRDSDEALTYYISLVDDARHLVVMTNPFGVDAQIVKSLETSSPEVVKLGLVGSGSPTGKAGEKVRRIDSIDGTRYTLPARVGDNTLTAWQEERFGRTHAYVHTKFLVVDPFGPSPTVVTGSANFSHASCVNNDENMLVIPGNPSVSDVYLTEFLRMFEHYAFRALLHESSRGRRPIALVPDDSWTDKYFVPGSERLHDRLLFSGTDIR